MLSATAALWKSCEPSGEPGAAYAGRLAARRAAIARAERNHRRLGNLRLAVFLGALGLAWLVLVRHALPPAWLLPPLGVYLTLVFLHERVLAARLRATRAAAWYEAGLARLGEQWLGRGPRGERFLAADHPYAVDLDLFGAGSLFERLSQARTRVGEETLAAWLREPADPPAVALRQAAARALAPRLDLREEWALLGERVGAGLHPDALRAWAAADGRPVAGGARAAAFALSALATVAGLGALLAGWPWRWLLAVLVLQGVLRLAGGRRWRRLTAGLDDAVADLELLAGALRLLEGRPADEPALAAVPGRPRPGGGAAWAAIDRLRRLRDAYDARRNMLFAPFAWALLWDLQHAFAIEAWRREHGPQVAGWLAAVGEFEALVSLAAYAWERPDDAWPELVPGGPLFDGEGIGHPLLPAASCVRNDLRLDGSGSLLVVSGSNMSGKSTLLRAVGLSCALAQAGAPVRARRLRLSPLAVGASLRVQDSWQDGVSRFYAEIRRLKQIVDLTSGPRPVLFLVDELLQGTNSHDRRVGAEAILRELLGRGAVGLVTTHDLALTELPALLAPGAANVHFADRLEAGRMVFDYRLHPGPVAHSNALALMRAVGLEVGPDAGLDRRGGGGEFGGTGEPGRDRGEGAGAGAGGGGGVTAASGGNSGSSGNRGYGGIGGSGGGHA